MTTEAQTLEPDHGPKSAKAGERFCALTRASHPTEDLIRFVVAPDGGVIADVKGKLPGRGVWITATHRAVAEAVVRRVFARSFKRDVRADGDLAAETGRMLERAALDALAIAGKGGHAVAGFTRVAAAIESGELVALIHASEAASDGKAKLDAVLRRVCAEKSREIAVIDAFSSAQLDLALSRLNVVHAALLGGPVSATFLTRTQRWLRYRTDIPAGGVRDLTEQPKAE